MMKKLLAFACLALALSWTSSARAASLFTNPIIMVTPMTLNFGSVSNKTTVTNTFVVQNAGGGKLVGKATVPAPFKILSGENYTLRPNEVQVVTITYTPTKSPMDVQTVQFTGGGGAKARVAGRLLPESVRDSALPRPK